MVAIHVSGTTDSSKAWLGGVESKLDVSSVVTCSSITTKGSIVYLRRESLLKRGTQAAEDRLLSPDRLPAARCCRGDTIMTTATQVQGVRCWAHCVNIVFMEWQLRHPEAHSLAVPWPTNTG